MLLLLSFVLWEHYEATLSNVPHLQELGCLRKFCNFGIAQPERTLKHARRHLGRLAVWPWANDFNIPSRLGVPLQGTREEGLDWPVFRKSLGIPSTYLLTLTVFAVEGHQEGWNTLLLPGEAGDSSSGWRTGANLDLGASSLCPLAMVLVRSPFHFSVGAPCLIRALTSRHFLTTPWHISQIRQLLPHRFCVAYPFLHSCVHF